ncbi:alpha/beta-hydrolase [Calocera viscosa TUFC12733]|uniref:Alpha/beta-hydrolase n=1 Tax=Calocera viscosa (strain TUFC12733) TaxID=1330018 RepID=A0A167JUY0_CALVF|nr:alpha/beta-hydrolase [Calocera viscosa TUFC12733]
MEKGFISPQPAQHATRSRYRQRLLTVALGLCTFIGYRVWSDSWMHCGHSGIKTSTVASGIAWSTCPDVTEFDCAYLSVPLDYTNPLPNETVSLALRRLPATAPIKERLGSLLTNPGGPGGSGTNSVVRSGPAMNIILKGRYDIVSWDPRAVNMTTPSLDCFPTDWDEYIQDLKRSQLGMPHEVRRAASLGGGSAEDAELYYFERVDSYSRSVWESCKKNGNEKMLSAVTSAFTARDMKSILEALGEEDRGMVYWGFSYGTMLGATFTAMFPELAHRILLDGVSNAVSFTTDIYKHGWIGTEDTNKVWQGFLTACAEAGPDGCALAHPQSTAKEIEGRIDALADKLITSPLPVPFTGLNSGIVAASDITAAIFSSMYKPAIWPKLAKALAAAEKGDGAPLADLNGFSDIAAMTRPTSMLDNIFNRHMGTLGGVVPSAAITCSDTDPSTMLSKPDAEDFMDYSRELEKRSVTGARWAQAIPGKCRFWNVTAREAYRGPWTVEDGFKKTKHPVLFLGNTADPVTPLISARTMSKNFGNESASLLIQDGFGHCSPAHPSLCTAHALQDFFFEGKLPEYGTVCKSDPGQLFPVEGAKEALLESLSGEDKELMRAMQMWAESF